MLNQPSYSQRISELPVGRFNPTHEYVSPEEMRIAAAEIGKEADARIADLLQACRRAQSVLRTAEGDIEDPTGKRVLNRTIELLTRAIEGLPVEQDMTIIDEHTN